MAVDKEDILTGYSEGLILKGKRRHYDVPVKSKHWQLRSLLCSADKPRALYVPGGAHLNHIIRLDTEQGESEVVRTLPFAPRCLAAKNGWVCCGSETGDFSAFRIDSGGGGGGGGGDDGRSIGARSGLDDISGEGEAPSVLDTMYEARPSVDPAEVAAGTVTGSGDSLVNFLSRLRRLKEAMYARTIKVAQQRVNCITLWFPPTDEAAASAAAYDKPVAVLANNDKTVAVMSLRRFETEDQTGPLDVITYPDFVNRAVISPDGTMLVAVLDDPYLYVHTWDKNEPVAESTSGSGRSSASGSSTARAAARTGEEGGMWTVTGIGGRDRAESRLGVGTGVGRSHSWSRKASWLLKSQKRDDRSVVRGSFALCFSNSGGSLAVGTQYGTISIFDVAKLADPWSDPLVTFFQSSRPETLAGAIRDMAFCPGSHDLLAWTEDRGRIGVVDVRSGYLVQQMLDITTPGDFEGVSVRHKEAPDPTRLRPDGAAQQDASGAESGSDGERERERERERLSPWRTLDDRVLARNLEGEELALFESLQQSERRQNFLRRRTGDSYGLLDRETGRNRADDGPAAAATDSPHRIGQRASNLSRALDAIIDFRQRLRANQALPSASQLRSSAARLRPTADAIEERLRTIQQREAVFGGGGSGGGGAGRDWQRVLDIARRYSMVAPSVPRPRESGGRLVASARAGVIDDAGVDLEQLNDIERQLERELEREREAHRDGHRDGNRDTNRQQQQRAQERAQERRRAARLSPFGFDTDWYRELEPIMGEIHDQAIFEVPPSPDNTTGVAWSPDGQILYVAAENGIYEFKVNLHGRKFCPSLVLR